jgi:hypothetical protein
MIGAVWSRAKVRTVESYRGLQVHVFDPLEEVPSWVRADIDQGRAVMAKGEFKSTAALAHILDRYIDEMLAGGSGGGVQSFGPPGPPRPRGGPR